MEKLPLYQPFYGASTSSREFADKAREVEAVGLAKRAEVFDRTPAEQLLLEFEEDRKVLSNPELRSIYGKDLTEIHEADMREQALRSRQAGRGRATEEITQDSSLSLLSGAVNLTAGSVLLAGDILSQEGIPHTGGVGDGLRGLLRETNFRENVVTPGTRLLGEFNDWRNRNSSAVKQADAAIMAEENAAAAALSEEQYLRDLQASDNEAEKILAGGKRLGRDFINDAGNLLRHPTVLADSVVEQVPTLGVGLAAKGLVSAESIASRAAAITLQREAKGLPALSVKATRELAETQLATRNLVTLVGLTEGGSSYGQEAGEILNTDFAELYERFPEVQQQVNAELSKTIDGFENMDDGLKRVLAGLAISEAYGNDTLSKEVREQITSALASRVGLKSAAITAPLAAVAGRLSAGFQLNPVGKSTGVAARQTVGRQVGDIAGEVAEETIQGGLAELSGNVARISEGDAEGDLLEGVGGAAGQGAVTAGVFSGTLRAPSISATAGIDAGKIVLGKIIDQGRKARDRIDAEAAQERNRAFNEMQVAATELTTAVAAAKPEAASVASVESDPIMNEEVVSKIRGDYTGSMSKLEALSRGMQAYDKEPDDTKAAQMGLALLKIAREVSQEALTVEEPSLREGMLRLANHDFLRELESKIGAMDPAVQQKLFDSLPADVLPEEGELDPQTAQVLEQVKELVRVAPDKITSEQATRALAQRKRLTPEDTRQLELALNVAQAREAHAAEVTKVEEQFPKTKTPSTVQFEIQEGNFEGKLSLADYVRRISQSMASGNVEAAKTALRNLQNFSNHMRARSASFDETAAKQKAEGKDAFYEVPIGGTIGKDGKLDRTTKFRLNINKPGSLATMSFVFADANAVAKTFNSLAQAYPELGITELHSTDLAPTFESAAPTPAPVAKPAATPAPASTPTPAPAPAQETAPEPAPAQEPAAEETSSTIEERRERNTENNREYNRLVGLESADEVLDQANRLRSKPSEDGLKVFKTALNKLPWIEDNLRERLIEHASNGKALPKFLADKLRRAAEMEGRPVGDTPVGKRGVLRDGDTFIEFEVTPKGVWLEKIGTRDTGLASTRGKGAARRLMNEFLRQVDELGLPSFLLAIPQDDSTNLDRLVGFYESVGYRTVEIKDGVPRMERAPQEQQVEEQNEDTQEDTAPPTTMQERFPGIQEQLGSVEAELTPQKKYQRTNKFLTGFKLAKASRALYARFTGKLNQIGEVLLESRKNPRALLKLLVPEHQFMDVSENQAAAMRDIMLQFLPQIVDTLNEKLSERMFKKSSPTSQTLFDELTNVDMAEKNFLERQAKRIAEAKSKGKELNTQDYLVKWMNPEQLSMHVLEWGYDEQGNPWIQYQPEVAEAMALAAINWVVGNINNPIQKPDINELTELYKQIPSQEIIDAHASGYALPAPIRTIANDITTILGITGNSDMSVTFTDGLPKSLALDVMQSMTQMGLVSIKEAANPTGSNDFSVLRFIQINDEESPKSLKATADRLEGRALLSRFLNPDFQDLPTFGEPSTVVPILATGTRQKLSQKQRSAIKKANKIPFYANMPLINILDSLGEDNMLSLLGYDFGELEALNDDHARTVRGVNQGLDTAVRNLREIYQLWQAKAEEQGKTIRDIPAFFSRRIISNGRMMMNGFGPQGDKIARETISAVRQVLDLRRNPRHQLAYHLTLAQALGIKTENKKHLAAQAEILADFQHPAYQALFANIQQLEQLQEGEERDALGDTITNQLRDLATGRPGNRPIGNKKGVLTSRAIHALVTHARYLAAVEAGNEDKFETFLAFELDGLTDGPINAIEHFGFWGDPMNAIEQVARGGHFINTADPTVRSDRVKEEPDLYETIATKVKEAIINRITNTPEDQVWKLKPLRASIDLLARIGHIVVDEQRNETKFQVVRAHAKGALMTMIYGAGKTSVVKVLASEIMTYVNEQLSEGLSSRTPLDPELQEALRIMMRRYRNSDGKWVDTPPLQLNNIGKYKSGMFSEVHHRALVDTLMSTAGGMLTSAVEAEMTNVLSTFKLLYVGSAFQSWSLKRNFDAAYEAKRQERIAAGELSPKDALSRTDEREIMKQLAAQVPAYALSMTGGNAQEEGINIVEKDYNGEIAIDGQPQKVRSLFGQLTMAINAARVSYPGVRAAALLTIALGDASMMTDLQNNDPTGTLDVYDGWEVGPAELSARALEVNKIVHENWQFDGLGSIVNAMQGMQLNIAELSPEEISELAEYVRLKGSDEMDIDELRAELTQLLETTVSNLETRAEQTRINKQILKEVPQSTDHMSGGQNPSRVEGEVKEDLAGFIAQRREELTNPQPADAPAPPAVQVLGRQQLFDMIAKRGFKSAIHKFVFDKIGHILPENLTIYIGTEAQMKEKQRELFPTVSFEQNATAWSYDNTVFLGNDSQESMIHELVHAATYRLLLRYYSMDGKGLSFFQKEGIRALDILAHEFTQLDLSDYDPLLHDDIALAQEVVREHLAAGELAEGVNEFMAWAMANEKLHIALGQTQGSSFLGGLRTIAKRIRSTVRKILGLPQNQTMETFMEQAMANFDRVTRRSVSPITVPHMPLNQALGGNPLSGSHGFRLQQLADDFQWMRMNLPRDGRNEAEILLAGADALVAADKIREAFADAGWDFSQEEQYAFEQLQALFASTAQLDAGTMTSLQQIYNQVMPLLTERDFLDNPADDSAPELEKAVIRFNALKGIGTLHTDKLGRSNDLANFVALALVNEPFRQKLSGLAVPKSKIQGENMDQKIRSAATAVFDWMSGTATLANKSINQREAIDKLVARLNRNQRLAVARSNSAPSRFAGVEKAVRDSVQGLGRKARDKAANRAAVGVDQGVDAWINRGLQSMFFLTTDEGAKAFAEGAVSWLNEANLPGVIQKLGSELVGLTDGSYPIGQLLNQVKHTVSRVRQRLRDEVPDQVRGLFTRSLTPAEWASLHKLVGKTDLQALFGKFTADQIRDFLTDPVQLQAAIANLEGQLGTGPEVGIWAQAAEDLGRFMVTGENRARVFLWRNPEAMAEMAGMGTQSTQETISRVAPILDQLTTLRALELTTAPERAFLSGLLETEKSGMEGLLRLMRSLNRAEFRKPDYARQARNRWKGHVPMSLDPRDDLVLATPAQGRKLLEQGYRLIAPYQGDPLDPGSLSYYAVTWSGGQATYNQGAMQTVEGSVGGVDRISGRSLQSFTKTMITAENTVNTITAQKLRSGSNSDHNLLPIFNNDGEVVAYERLLERSLLEQHLTSHLDLAKSIGMWMGRQAEEEIAVSVNRKLTEVLKKIWDDGKRDHREAEFIDITSSQAPAAVKDAWAAVPRETQDLLRSTFGEHEPIMVRKDMIDNALGYRSASVANVFTGMSDLPKPVQDTIVDAAFGLMGIVGKERETYRYLLTAERAWQSLVATAKDVIVVRSGIVALANGIANQFQLLQMGVPVNRLLQSQVSKIRETETYLRNEKRIAQLQFAKSAAKNQAELNSLIEEQRVLTDANTRLSIWPLIEAGELPTIAEGLTEQDEYTIMKDFTGWLEKKLKDVPPGLTTAAKYALITKDTALYLGLNRAIQFGDFMAKSVSYDLFVSQGMTQEQALRKVTETFVNYNLLPGRTRDYLESMGLTWFLNYKIRIAKIVLRTLRENPLRFLMAGAGAEWLGADSLVSSSPLETNWGYAVGPGQFFRAHDLLMWNQLVD